MNLFRPDFLHLTMLRLISLYTLSHNILHEGADGKAFLMCNGLHLVNKGFGAYKGEMPPRVVRTMYPQLIAKVDDTYRCVFPDINIETEE